MRAELKSLDSADALEGLAAFEPSDPEHFELAVGAIIGPVGIDGGDLFYFHVVTASWLGEHPPHKGFEFLRDLLVTRWDFGTVRGAISDLILHTEGENWDEIAIQLSRASHWEFEGYRD
jgi:Immunity protein 8